MESFPTKHPQFIIIGCGGAGTTIIDQIGKTPISNILTIATDTDNQALASRQSDIPILLGKDLPSRWGEGDPTDAGAAVQVARFEIKAMSLTNEINTHADVTWGTRIKSFFNGKVQVTGIMTGIQQHSSGEINRDSQEKKSGGKS